MTKGNLSNFANYCRDRGIVCLLCGFAEDEVYFDVTGIRTERVRKNFEKRVQQDNPGIAISIQYIRSSRTEPENYIKILTP